MAPFLEDIERELPRALGTIIATEGDRRVEARWMGSRRDGDRLWATMQVVLYEGSNAVDATEGEILLGALESEDRDRPWTPAMHHAVARFTAAIESNLARLARDASAVPQPHDLWPEISAVDFFVTWAKLGPAPPRPERFPKASLDAAGLLRLLPKATETTLNLPPEAGPIAAAYALDGWSIVVCMPEEEQGEGRVVLFTPEGARGHLLVEALDAGSGMSAIPIDGDTVTLRGVVTWLASIIRVMRLDREFGVSEDHIVHGLSITQWLQFRDRDSPQIDWRLQGDAVGDGPLHDGHDPLLRTAEGRASAPLFCLRKIPLAEVDVYDRFIRTFIDPEFVSPAKLAAGSIVS